MINPYFKERGDASLQFKTKYDKLVALKTDRLPLLVLFLLPVLFLHNGIFSGGEVISASNTDIKLVFFFTRFFGFNSLRDSILPLWNPYIFGGMPFIATLHTSIFYPFNLIFLLFSTAIAINYSILLHLFLSGVFTYYLLKYYGVGKSGSVAGGIVYTFSAPQVMHIYAGHLNVLTAMVWTPLMFLFLDRFVRGDGVKYAIFLSFTVTLQLLAGQPQYLFYSMIALSFYLLFLLIWLRVDGASWIMVSQKSLAYAAVIILGLALSAVQLLPTMELTRYSTRTSLAFEWVSIFSFPPENFITFLMPDFFGDTVNIPYWAKNYFWEMTVYVGILPLLLSIVSVCYVRKKIVYFFWGLAIFSLIFAMGKYTPLLEFLYAYVPGFNLFRGNSKFIFLNAFSLAVLSGFGADAFVKGCNGLKKWRFRIGIIALSLTAAVIVIVMTMTFDGSWFKEAITEHVQSGDFYNKSKVVMAAGFEDYALGMFRQSSLWFVLLLISGSALLLLHSYGKLNKNIFMVSLLAFIIFDLFSFGMRYMVTFNKSEVYWGKEVVNYLKKDKKPFRVITPEMGINTGVTSRIESLGGYDTIIVKRYSEFINFSQGTNPDRPRLWLNIKKVNKLTNMLNAKYLLLPSYIKFKQPVFKQVFSNNAYNIYQNQDALPRAFIVYEDRIIKGRDAIFKEMADREFDPIKYAVIEEELENGHLSPDRSTGQTQEIKFSQYSPDKIIMDIENPQRGLLLLGNVYYPGWKAYIDDQEAKIYSANYIMQAVELPAGRHTVMFYYRPFSFEIGAIISIVTIIFMVLLIKYS